MCDAHTIPAVSEKDIDEFRRAMQGTKPLQSEQRVPVAKPKPRPTARFSKADEQAVLTESLEDDVDTLEHDSGGALRFHRQHVGKRTMRKLQRGAYSVQAEIDLHGMRLAEAKIALQDFLRECALRGIGCVRIVHGKGMRSGPEGPILKPSVHHWLARADQVLAFVTAQPRHGGSGAIYVLLRRG